MKKAFLIVAIVACINLSVAGQERPDQPRVSGFVVGGVDVLNNMGYSLPKISIGGGVEMNSKLGLSISQASFSITHKIETQDGHSREWETANYARFHKFLLGAGTKYSHLTTSQWEKGGWKPFVGTGYAGESNRFQLRYIVPSFDVQNRLSGVQTIYDYRGSSHWGVEMKWGVYRFKDTRVPGVYYAQSAEKHSGEETGLALKYFF